MQSILVRAVVGGLIGAPAIIYCILWAILKDRSTAGVIDI